MNIIRFESFCCCYYVLLADEGANTPVSRWELGKQLSAPHSHRSCPPQPSSCTGPRWTLLTERRCGTRSSCRAPPRSAAMLLLESNDSSVPLYLPGISMLSFFFSPLCSFSPVQFSLNFITAFLPSVSVHPHSSTLTLNGKVPLSVGNADNRLFRN